MISEKHLLNLFKVFSALIITQGRCGQEGWYVPARDLVKDIFENKRYFRVGDEMSDDVEWVYIGDNYSIII
jgi:hypothetical protein